MIEVGAYSKEVRRIARAVRLTIGIRLKITTSVILSFLSTTLQPGSEAHARLTSYLPKVLSIYFAYFVLLMYEYDSTIACFLLFFVINDWFL